MAQSASQEAQAKEPSVESSPECILGLILWWNKLNVDTRSQHAYLGATYGLASLLPARELAAKEWLI